jgi:hypothetical protein
MNFLLSSVFVCIHFIAILTEKNSLGLGTRELVRPLIVRHPLIFSHRNFHGSLSALYDQYLWKVELC